MNAAEQVPVMDDSQMRSPRLSKKKIIIIAVALDIIILIIVAFYFLKADTSTGQSGFEKIRSEISSNEALPSPTPFPFQELTVPYLRNKTYSSKLEKQEEQVSANDNYTSHLASYISDGHKINGLLTIPVGDTPTGGHPAIIFVHGYIPPAQYSTTGEAYSSYVDYLARSGFVVFKIDLRGHGDSEGEAGGGYFGSDYIVDTLNAYDALKTSTFVHPEKIGLWGHSMAGNILLRSVAVKPEIPAASIWAGAVFTYTDREKYGINDASFQMSSLSPERQSRRRQLIEKYGEPSENSEFWKMVIPTNYLTDFKGAIQLNHAKDDTVVDIGYSRDLSAILEKSNVTHEFYEYESGGHDIEDGSFVTAMDRTVAFFRKYLND
jgi:uncharacterized protein